MRHETEENAGFKTKSGHKAALAAALLLTSSAAHAGFNDPWYGFYRTKGGLVMTVGPFSDKYSCGAAKYNIPFDATWLGCRQ